MALLVYITPKCEKDAKGLNCWDDVTRLQQQLLKSQRTTFFNNFPPPYLKKRFKKQHRLIAEERPVGEHVVVIFYRLMIRGGRDYRQFLKDQIGYGRAHFQPMVSDETLEAFIEEQMRVEPPAPKSPPSLVEQTFLYDLYDKKYTTASEDYIFESSDWIQSLGEDRISMRLESIRDMLLAILEGPGQELEANVFQIWEDKGLTIYYSYYPTLHKLFLGGITYGHEEETFRHLNEKYREILTMHGSAKENESEERQHNLIKASKRSYPALALADLEPWIKIIRDDEANIALSPEESQLLASVHNQEEPQGADHATDRKKETTGFPLFINGRAGSGKSTILQYLFSDYMRAYLDRERRVAKFTSSEKVSEELVSLRPPLYLTYSEELVKRSRKLVESLLSTNHSAIIEELGDKRTEIPDLVRRSILVFREYLLGLLPEEEREQKFDSERYVDYRLFKQLWKEKFGRDRDALKQFSPELSWHIIRSYIKGNSIDGYLDPEEYEELQREEVSVTPETFRLVYNRVWERWYQPLYAEGWWDDQDLVRHILDGDLALSTLPAIFCDEAQDFTRIELELLLRINLFSERKISSLELNRIPFAFAGDPFQTLNPTGFRWEAMNDSFVNKFIHSMSPELKFGKNELNYKELSFNYRSSQNIVKLSNTIQVLRMKLFGYHHLQPQETWGLNQQEALPCYFDLNEPSTQEELKNAAQGGQIQIIVPCIEGEEREYVDADPVLKAVVAIDEESGLPQNVMSPSRAKGLEYNRVVVYGFGQYLKEQFNCPVHQQATMERGEQSLAWEYFINQLYVSVSRPRRRLMVLDTADGLNYLWRVATDPDDLAALLTQIKSKEAWQDKVGNLVKGNENCWSGDQEAPQDIAKRQEEEGSINRDSFLLTQAAITYGQLGLKVDEARCRAWGYFYDREYLRAGSYFVQSYLYQEALSAFWRVGAYEQIQQYLKPQSDLGQRLELRITDFLLSDAPMSRLEGILEEVQDYLQAQTNALEKRKIVRDAGWLKAVSSSISQNLPPVDQLPISSREEQGFWHDITLLTQGLVEQGMRINAEIRGHLAMAAGMYKQASSLLQEEDSEQAIQLLEQAHLQMALAKPEEDLNEEERRVVARHVAQKGEFARAALQYRKLKEPVEIYSIIRTVRDRKAFDEMDEVVEQWILTLTETGQWEAVIEIFATGQYEGRRRGWIQRRFSRDTARWVGIFTKGLAVSPLLPNAENRFKEPVSNFLKESYLDKSITTWLPHVHPLVVGAALERSGRNIDCLSFYERLERNLKFHDALRHQAGLRWLHVKQLQARREQESEFPALRERAVKHEEEAEAKARSLGLQPPVKTPMYPAIEPYLAYQGEKEVFKNLEPERMSGQFTTVRPPVSTSDRPKVEEFTIADIHLKLARPLGRLNLENQTNLQTAVVLLGENRAQSSDIDIEQRGNTFDFHDWNLRLHILGEGKQARLKLIHPPTMEEIWVEV